MPDDDPKNPSKNEIEELKRILEFDILESIEANYKAGNITVDDYNQLGELTNELYMQVLLNYEEKGGDTAVKELLPGAIELPNDVYRIRTDELEEQNGALTEQNGALTEQNGALTEQNGALTEQNGALTEQNSALKEQNSELQGQKSELEARNTALEDEVADLRRRLREAEKRKKQ
ncbi:MAG: hypothetical protein LIP12_18305 [Clostridiales bacterium]|nr:hypothetical protein [Clostridiales bacterium]